MGELKQVYQLIQQEIVKGNVKKAFDAFNIHYNGIKDIKGFQNFTISVISTLAQKLQSELDSSIQNALNINYVIQFANDCFKILVLSELQPFQNSLYVIVRYLLVNNHVSEAVHFTSFLFKKSNSPCNVLKHLVQLFTHYIHKMCPVDDDLKKINVIMIWDATLNLVKCYTEKEIEYALKSLSTLVKNINGLILHEGRSMDLAIMDMTLESVLSSSVFRKKSDQENMMTLYAMLIENIAAVMQNMMRNKQLRVHFITKHIELMIDVCCLDKTEKEALSFLLSLFKFIDSSIKNGLDSNFEIRKIIQFVQKYESTTVLPNTILYHVLKASVITVTKLKNLWYEGLIINSPETTLQMFVLLQKLVDVSKHNSINQACCKNSDCDLNEDSTSEISLINIVFIIIRHTITTHKTFLNSGDVQKWLDLFISLFERVNKSNCSNKISFIEFSLTSAYNLCMFMTTSEFKNLFLDFLENIFLKFDPCGIDQDLVARVAVLLSRYLYNTNKHYEALKCVAYWCVRTRSELAARQWVYFKCKEELNNRTVNETIVKMFENDIELKKKWPDYCFKKSDYIEIMWLELKAHNQQHKIKQNTSAVLELFEELMGNKLPRELKSQIIITTAYVILHSNSINGLKTVIDVLEDYIRKLEVELSIENKSMPLVLGNLYYANFMCLTKHLQSLVSKELDSYIEERSERGMEQQNTILYESMSWILPLKIKPKLLNCLKWAVKNWSDVVSDTIKDEYDVNILYKSLQEVAFIFKLHCDSKEVEVWQLLYKTASNKKCHKYMFIALSELIKIGETDVSELDSLTKNLPKMVIDYKLTLATSFLNQSKFNDALTILESIDDKELNNVLLMAEYSYLKSRISFESGKFYSEKCLSIFIEAYNISHSLIKRLDSFFEYLNMHFVILSICAYLNLIFINMFKPVEARCFLKVQMNIVLKSVLTKRALNVFMMNCWNDLMCCSFENANGQLDHVMTLLDFKADDMESKLQKLTINPSPKVLSSPMSDYRCMPKHRMTKTASPTLKRFNDKDAQMSITEFCKDSIINNKTHDSIIIYSVIEVCTLKAVYYSKLDQQQIAEKYFKLAFKSTKSTSPHFNKNEVYNILSARQNSLINYQYIQHLIHFSNLSKASDWIKKQKPHPDEWLTLSINELSILLKIDNIMECSKPNVVHSPVAKASNYEFKTPKTTRIRINTTSPVPSPRYVTPVVRKLKMTLDSPKTKGNKIKAPPIRETEITKKDTAAKKKTGKENILKSTTKDIEHKVKEKKSTRKNEVQDQLPLVIKTRSNRLNI